MFTFFLIVHSLICILLVIVILMQAGRGGGLTENFSSAESVFGAQTSAVMIKITTILGTIFLASSLNLTFLSLHKDKSLLESMPDVIEKNLPQFNSEMNKAQKAESKVMAVEKMADSPMTSTKSTNATK